MSGRYLSQAEVCDYLSMSRTTVARLVMDKVLPDPIYLRPRLPRWDRDAIDAIMVGRVIPTRQSPDEIANRIADENYQKGFSS